MITAIITKAIPYHNVPTDLTSLFIAGFNLVDPEFESLTVFEPLVTEESITSWVNGLKTSM